MGYYIVRYVVEGTAETDTFSKEEFDEKVKELTETGKLHYEKNESDFGRFKVYLTPTSQIIHETDEENPRLTIFSNQKPEVYGLEGRIKSISEPDFQKVEQTLRRMYGSPLPKSNGYFGSYYLWENIGDAAKCILEYKKIGRINIHARDKNNFRDIASRLHLN